MLVITARNHAGVNLSFFHFCPWIICCFKKKTAISGSYRVGFRYRFSQPWRDLPVGTFFFAKKKTYRCSSIINHSFDSRRRCLSNPLARDLDSISLLSYNDVTSPFIVCLGRAESRFVVFTSCAEQRIGCLFFFL